MRFEKLAALGPVVMAAGLLVVYVLAMYVFAVPHPATAGMNTVQGILLVMSVGLLVLALMAVQLNFAWQLWREANARR